MIIGITGSFGSGKTTVAKMFAKLGAYAIDADKIYHSLIRPGKSCYKKIVRYFGKGILGRTGQIDKQKLGKIVFKDKAKLKTLNRLTHPEVIKEIKKIIKAGKGKVIVIEAPLLIESGFYKQVDKVILVANDREEQVKRVREDRGLAAKETFKRIRMQMPFKKKLAFADFIIDNSGSKLDTLNQVTEIWKQRGV
ncbi:MAG: dephospho-CoA kinase [Candidatus Omnitrophica bacterium]|nr:dephospho-CoA kinase [Candidatus Omnitrophota bacterium]